MERNFRCPKTNKEFFIPQYKTKIVEGKAVYTDKWGKTIVNPENNEPLIYIPKEGKVGVPAIGTGKGPSGKAKLQKMLKKRAHQDYKKNVEEKARQMTKDTTRGLMG
jgi:hypothetical protein